jgi:hypothetical protein
LVDAFGLGVAGFAPAVEDIGVLCCFDRGEDFGRGGWGCGVCLEEVGCGTGGGEFGWETGEGGEDFVDETDFRGEVVGVDVKGEETADITCGGVSRSVN